MKGSEVRVSFRVSCPACAGLGFVPTPGGGDSRRTPSPGLGPLVYGEGQLCRVCLGATVTTTALLASFASLHYEPEFRFDAFDRPR